MAVLHFPAWGQGAPNLRVNILPERIATMLRAGGMAREEASQELRDQLVRAALSYLARQRYPVVAFGADSYASIAEDYAQEAFTILAIP